MNGRCWNPGCPTSQRQGFTLIEVSVALLLLSMVLTFVYQSFLLTVQTKERVERGSEVFQAARVTLQRIEQELQSAYIESARGGAVVQQGGAPAQGSLGAARAAFVGVHALGDGYPRDRLDFTTLAHYVVAAAGRDDRQADHEEVGYYPETDFKAARTDLMHREDFTLDDDPLGGGDIFPLLEGIKGFGLRYLDPQSKTWTDSWDSRERGMLPAAVEISLWVVEPADENRELYFSKLVRLPMHTRGALNPLRAPQAQTPTPRTGAANEAIDVKNFAPTVLKFRGDNRVDQPADLWGRDRR